MSKSNEKLGALQRAVLLIMPRTRLGMWSFIALQFLATVFLNSLALLRYRPDFTVFYAVELVAFFALFKYIFLALSGTGMMFKSLQKPFLIIVYLLAVTFAFFNYTQIDQWLNMGGLNPFTFLLYLWIFLAEYIACLGFFRMVKPKTLSV